MNPRTIPSPSRDESVEHALLQLLDGALLATENALLAQHPEAFSHRHCGCYFSPEEADIRALVEHAHRLRAHLRRRQATLATHSAERIEEETEEALF